MVISLMGSKAFMGSKVHTGSSLKEDMASLGGHMEVHQEVHQEVMEGVMKVKSACHACSLVMIWL